MKRRAPGPLTVTPLRGWPGALVAFVSMISLVTVLGGGAGVAYAAGKTDRSSKRRSLVTLPAKAAATEPDDETAETTPAVYATRTIAATYYDESRDRVLNVTITAPNDSGAFPLVVLVHGFNASAATYATLETEVAEAGFVVAAPDFPVSSSAVSSSPSRDIVAQATDVSFIIDQLLSDETAPASLVGSIANGPVAVIGHSDGGVTAAGVAFNSAAADPRIGAAVVMSGGAFDFSGSWFTGASTPALLAIHGTDDTVNPIESSESLYDEATGPKWLVAVDGGSHVGPFTTDDSVGSVAAVISDFLHAYLEGDAAAANRLPTTADASPLKLLAAA